MTPLSNPPSVATRSIQSLRSARHFSPESQADRSFRFNVSTSDASSDKCLSRDRLNSACGANCTSKLRTSSWSLSIRLNDRASSSEMLDLYVDSWSLIAISRYRGVRCGRESPAVRRPHGNPRACSPLLPHQPVPGASATEQLQLALERDEKPQVRTWNRARQTTVPGRAWAASARARSSQVPRRASLPANPTRGSPVRPQPHSVPARADLVEGVQRHPNFDEEARPWRWRCSYRCRVARLAPPCHTGENSRTDREILVRRLLALEPQLTHPYRTAGLAAPVAR